MPTEEEIRAWVRDEQAKILQERQEACPHSVSGNLDTEWKITCSNCGKVIADWRAPEGVVPFRGYGNTESARNQELRLKERE